MTTSEIDGERGGARGEIFATARARAGASLRPPMVKAADASLATVCDKLARSYPEGEALLQRAHAAVAAIDADAAAGGVEACDLLADLRMDPAALTAAMVAGVAIDGRLHHATWEVEGAEGEDKQRRSKVEVIAHRVELLDGPRRDRQATDDEAVAVAESAPPTPDFALA